MAELHRRHIGGSTVFFEDDRILATARASDARVNVQVEKEVQGWAAPQRPWNQCLDDVVVAKKVCKKRATPDRLRDYTLFDHFRRMKIVTLAGKASFTQV